MEAQAALDCVNQIWSHNNIEAYVRLICIDDNASTKAYLQHSFFDLDSKNMPRPKNKKKLERKMTKESWERITRSSSSWLI
jgi:hypothetical protein